MGEARRRAEKGLPPKQPKANQQSPTSFLSLLPLTKEKKEQFFSITQTGAWIGIILLILFWITVRFIGPTAGWWTPADAR